MHKERRKLFQKVSFMGDEPKATFSVNMDTWRWWLWLGGRLAACFAAVWFAISFVAGDVFDQRLNQFHEIAKPEIEELIAEEIGHHDAKPAHGSVIERITEIERHDAEVDARTATKLEEMEKRLIRIENGVAILVRNGNGH